MTKFHLQPPNLGDAIDLGGPLTRAAAEPRATARDVAHILAAETAFDVRVERQFAVSLASARVEQPL